MRIGQQSVAGRTRSTRRLAIPAIAFVIAFAALAFQTTTATAAEVRTGESPSVATTETVDADIYLFGGEVDIDGTVRGDAIVSSGTLKVPGRIDGSLSVFAGRIEIQGTIGGSVRVAAGEVTITGEVGRDVVVAGGTVTIESAATVSGDLIVAGGDVSVLGPVEGDVRGNVGSLTINAPVGGDVRVHADDVHLEAKADVAGNLEYTSRDDAKIDNGASVTGSERHTEPARFYPGDNLASWFGSAIFRLLCALFAGVTIVLLLPRAATIVADGISDAPASSFILGLVLLVLIPILVLILLVTVVGIPIALILLASYACALYLSQIFLGLAIGRMLLPQSWDMTGRGFNLLAMAIGVVALAGLRVVPLPAVGTVVGVITGIFGLGAIILGPRRLRAQAVTFPRY